MVMLHIHYGFTLHHLYIYIHKYQWASFTSATGRKHKLVTKSWQINVLKGLYWGDMEWY